MHSCNLRSDGARVIGMLGDPNVLVFGSGDAMRLSIGPLYSYTGSHLNHDLSGGRIFNKRCYQLIIISINNHIMN